jgi:hypothetical protein
MRKVNSTLLGYSLKPAPLLASLRKFENFHIVLWLIKDTCWVMDFHVAGLVMIVPTLGMAIFITWQSRKFPAELFHNIAVCFWVIANTTWMIGEFFYEDTTRPWATIFFICGLIAVSWYYVSGLWKKERIVKD